MEEPIEKTEKMLEYERETGKNSIWRGKVTESFKKWASGEKIYTRHKERICLYVTEDTKEKWQKFVDNTDYTTISKLIRNSVNLFVDNYASMKGQYKGQSLDESMDISHELKEPLTIIKGFSQLLLENYLSQSNDEVTTLISNILEQSIHIENKIKQLVEGDGEKKQDLDVLVVEDNRYAIKLIMDYFLKKGYSCKGVVSGQQCFEVMKYTTPKLILLDVVLPDINGFEICKQIREEHSDIPIYYITAVPSSRVKENLDITQANGYIAKPFDLSEFKVFVEILESNRCIKDN